MVEQLLNYPYLTGVFILAIPWMLLLIKTHAYKKLIFIGVLFGIAAILIGQLYALNDYWSPAYIFSQNIPIEDFLYGFFISGILSAFYTIVHVPQKYERVPQHIIVFGVVPFFVTILSLILLVNILQINSIVAHIVPPLFVGVLISAYYPHLLLKSLTNGILGIVLVFLLFQILLFLSPTLFDAWLVDNLTGIFIINIPLEEYLFGFSLAFGIAFYYEALTGKIPYWDESA